MHNFGSGHKKTTSGGADLRQSDPAERQRLILKIGRRQIFWIEKAVGDRSLARKGVLRKCT